MKYLVSKYSDVAELKKAFRDLLMVLHPDKGGSNEECAVLISEYESLIKRIPKKAAVEREAHKPESQRVYRPSDFHSYDEGFVNALMGLISLHMENVEIEACGWFLYVAGDTKTHKEEIKKLGLVWNNLKSMWVWKPSWYQAPKGHKPWEMDKIRQAYGSKKVEEERGLVVSA